MVPQAFSHYNLILSLTLYGPIFCLMLNLGIKLKDGFDLF